MKALPNRLQKANNWSCIFQQWDPHWLDCLFNLYYEEEWWQSTPLSESNIHGERLW